ncbi:rhamnogalacturonan endolyase family protein [Asanoa siamensis]|uniref:Rhamnogalacturonan I lyase beta-sheet domain-containing protein n=1 Tax=Asanoa siamensis TaxID=926357 RepID=A0ABQ4CPU2_9ACTN|nr:hypothetical protein [Asanoa siamensis]GIF73013.1 hypothetical protein Asi02nite_25310 [Asanoa siamensis]
MSTRPTLLRAGAAAACAVTLVLGGPAPAGASGDRAGIRLERLDRGLVAVPTAEGVFLSWRLLRHEASGSSATGLTGADFHVYRDGRRVATVTDSTNYLDRDATASASYRVAAVVRGREIDRGAAVSP